LLFVTFVDRGWKAATWHRCDFMAATSHLDPFRALDNRRTDHVAESDININVYALIIKYLYSYPFDLVSREKVWDQNGLLRMRVKKIQMCEKVDCQG